MISDRILLPLVEQRGGRAPEYIGRSGWEHNPLSDKHEVIQSREEFGQISVLQFLSKQGENLRTLSPLVHLLDV